MSARVLVCGGREYANAVALSAVLDAVREERGIACVITGGATGADRLASEWAKRRFVPCRTFPANWTLHGRAAGPIRNQYMIDEGKPDLVVAFPGGKGTADMVRRAEAAGVEVLVFEPTPLIETVSPLAQPCRVGGREET